MQDPRLAIFLSKVDKWYIDWKKKRELKRPGMFHTSSIIKDKFCFREAYWDITEKTPPEISAPSTLRVFANGVDVHERTQKILKDLRIAIYIEQPFYSKFLDLCGTPDAIIDFFGITTGVEIKSMNTTAFYHLNAPPKNAVAQAQVYMYLLGIPQFIIWVENKNDQNIKLFLIEFDLDEALKYIKRMRKLYKYLIKKKVPKAKDCWCNNKHKRKTCRYFKRCFK